MARLARNVLVGDLKEDFFITVNIIKILPLTPRQNVKLKYKIFHFRLSSAKLNSLIKPRCVIKTRLAKENSFSFSLVSR